MVSSIVSSTHSVEKKTTTTPFSLYEFPKQTNILFNISQKLLLAYKCKIEIKELKHRANVVCQNNKQH